MSFAPGRSAGASIYKNNPPGYPGVLYSKECVFMEFCTRYSKVAWTRDYNRLASDNPTDSTLYRAASVRNNHLVALTRLRCGQWDCEYCARKNQSIWRGFLHEKLPSISSEWWLLTLTASSLTRSAAESYKNLQSGIDMFMKRIRRHHGDIEYVRTFEKHPTSEALHAHFIITGLSPFVVPGCHRNLQPGYLAVLTRQWRVGVWSLQTYLKRMAHECGMGYMADGKPLPTDRAVNYCTKYLTKDLQGINIPNLRHVQTTRGIGAPGEKSEKSWVVADYATMNDFDITERVIDLNTGQQIDSDYWQEFRRYPPEQE